jgi:hypothetical protein
MSSSGAKRICVGFCDRTQRTTIKSGHIGLWTKMRRSGGQFSGPESSLQIQSLADFITTTSESRFSVHTAIIVAPSGYYCPPIPTISVELGNIFGRQVVSLTERFRRLIVRSVPSWINSATESNSKGSSICAADCRGQHLILRLR